MKSYRIRRLTPLECWRLMGFSDENFKAAEENKLNSNTQLYAQAGNSIVVNVLEAILGEMLPKGSEAERTIVGATQSAILASRIASEEEKRKGE